MRRGFLCGRKRIARRATGYAEGATRAPDAANGGCAGQSCGCERGRTASGDEIACTGRRIFRSTQAKYHRDPQYVARSRAAVRRQPRYLEANVRIRAIDGTFDSRLAKEVSQRRSVAARGLSVATALHEGALARIAGPRALDRTVALERFLAFAASAATRQDPRHGTSRPAPGGNARRNDVRPGQRVRVGLRACLPLRILTRAFHPAGDRCRERTGRFTSGPTESTDRTGARPDGDADDEPERPEFARIPRRIPGRLARFGLSIGNAPPGIRPDGCAFRHGVGIARTRSLGVPRSVADSPRSLGAAALRAALSPAAAQRKTPLA